MTSSLTIVLSLYYTVKINSMLTCICSVIDLTYDLLEDRHIVDVIDEDRRIDDVIFGDFFFFEFFFLKNNS